MIKPINGKIQIKIEQPKVGGLDLSSKETAIEVAEVVALPAHIEGQSFINLGLNVGDKIMVKAWSIDVLTWEGEKYYFVDSDSKGICAII